MANLEVQKVVDKKLKIPRVKKGVERVCQFIISKEKEKEQDKKLSEKVWVFMTAINYITSTDYNLWDSFILDLKVIIYVCNSCQCFATFIPASEDDLLYTKNIVVLIKGFGSVNIMI